MECLQELVVINPAVEHRVIEAMHVLRVHPYAPLRVGSVSNTSATRIDVTWKGVPIRIICHPNYTYLGYRDKEGAWQYIRNPALFKRRFADTYPGALPDHFEPPPHIKIRLEKEERERQKRRERIRLAEEATAAAKARQEAVEAAKAERAKVAALAAAQRTAMIKEKAAARAAAARAAKKKGVAA